MQADNAVVVGAQIVKGIGIGGTAEQNVGRAFAAADWIASVCTDDEVVDAVAVDVTRRDPRSQKVTGRDAVEHIALARGVQ